MWRDDTMMDALEHYLFVYLLCALGLLLFVLSLWLCWNSLVAYYRKRHNKNKTPSELQTVYVMTVEDAMTVCWWIIDTIFGCMVNFVNVRLNSISLCFVWIFACLIKLLIMLRYDAEECIRDIVDYWVKLMKLYQRATIEHPPLCRPH